MCAGQWTAGLQCSASTSIPKRTEAARSLPADLSTPQSRVRILAIATNEEMAIARFSYGLLSTLARRAERNCACEHPGSDSPVARVLHYAGFAAGVKPAPAPSVVSAGRGRAALDEVRAIAQAVGLLDDAPVWLCTACLAAKNSLAPRRSTKTPLFDWNALRDSHLCTWLA